MAMKLKVSEAATKDVGRALARVDPEVIRGWGIAIGDAVEIRAARRAVAKVMPLAPDQRGESRIALDGLTRENAGAMVGETVEVSPVPCAPAETVDITPLGLVPKGRDLDYVGRLLDGLIVREGSKIRATLFGSRAAEFLVARTVPAGAVVLQPLTRLNVLASAGNPAAGPGSQRRLSYEDVGGLKPQLGRIREMIELPLRHPQVFERLGIDPPKGVLLYGPPGTGKTLIARAIAQEANAKFFTISGPEIIHKFYGESEAHLRRVFEEASRQGPSIIFLDEIDAIAPRRERTAGDVEKRVVAQLLALMDGLNRRQNVIVIAATNLPDSLDPALRRPGRFDREIAIPVPDRPGRREILEIHSHGMPLAVDVSLDHLAARTHGFVGADLEALCREAAMRCLRRVLPAIDLNAPELPYEWVERLEVTGADFESALNEIEPSAMRDAFVEVPEVRWEDVGGLADVRRVLTETVIWPLARPQLFREAGVRPSRGVLLHGPPGCGKTLVARAIATESGVNFLSVKGPALLSRYVGDSEQAVRDIFRKARQAAPCIIFFDEMDAIAPARSGADNPVADRVLTQLLTEMDGVEELTGVLILGATNRVDRLDPAILRPGRFDQVISLPLPDRAARAEIFALHLKNKPLDSPPPLQTLAQDADGMSGADIMAAVRAAAMAAIRRGWDGEAVVIRTSDIVAAVGQLRGIRSAEPAHSPPAGNHGGK